VSSAPDIAVVSVVVDSAGDVARMLDELEAQRGVVLDEIVVDNGSHDGSQHEVLAHPHARLIANGRNCWLSPAWMQGVRASSAPYVLFLTPDLSLRNPNALATLRAALEADPLAAVAGPRLVGEDGRDLRNGSFAWPTPKWVVAAALGVRRRRLYRPPAAAPPRAERHRPVRFVNGACMLVRRVALEAVGGLDEDYRLYWEEIDFARRLRRAGWRILVVPTVTGVHRGKGTPSTPGLRENAYAQGERLYMRKHHGRLAALAVGAARKAERLRHTAP
jgi:GT2 family glycosyltransferase